MILIDVRGHSPLWEVLPTPRLMALSKRSKSGCARRISHPFHVYTELCRAARLPAFSVWES